MPNEHNEPIRVLQVMTNMSYGGLENLLMNYYRQIDRTKVQFDFLTHVNVHQDFQEEIAALGGKLHRLPRFNPLSPGYRKALKDFFREHPEYRIVHSHLNCMSAVPLKAAKQCGVPVRIAHSHTSSVVRNLKMVLKYLYRPLIPRYATALFACGRKAGDWMFRGAPYTIVRNAVDAKSFRHDPALSRRMREELGLGNSFVVGHVGQFRTEKNHLFLIDIFAEVLKLHADSRLVLVGKGPNLEPAIEKAEGLGIREKILFLGARPDIPELMQAMDVFVLPSLYEGLPVTMVEAQSAGLPCVISDGVPLECALTDSVEQISLEAAPSVWAEAILSRKGREAGDHYDIICAAGFDIRTNAIWLEDYYCNACKNT